MTQVFVVSNPFDPRDGLLRHEASDGITVRQWLEMAFGPDFIEFEQPTICQVNGRYVLREEWDALRFRDGDVVAFIALPGGVVAIVIAIIAIAIAIFAVMMVQDPRMPNSQEGETVHSLRGQTNRLRLGEPIETHYGRVRIWPSYAAPPYSRYANNDQFQFSLFCVGQGEYTLDELYIEDTLLSNFEEVEYEVIPPGESTTLFNANVFTAVEVNSIELYGPNQDAYTGAAGPFVINAAGTNIHKVEVDVVFPQGLFQTDDEGDVHSATVNYAFEVRKVDSAGAAIGGWSTVISGGVTRSTRTPQRFTFSAEVSAGRYEIRGQRVSDKSGDIKVNDSMYWEAAKGYARFDRTYPTLTLIALKARATNSLNNNTRSRFNLFATRKLPRWDIDTQTWLAAANTRNPVWAALDIFRASYGARLEDEYLDLDAFAELATVADNADDKFDFTYDQRMTIWDAVKLALTLCRTVPIAQGSVITAVRDEPATLPAAVFNQHNIVAGSLTKQLQLFAFNDFDCASVEYVHPTTWKPEEVIASLPGRTQNKPERVRLPGCTSRQRAYRWGMYLRARREWQRKTVKFRTGLEGHIPSFMDLVSVTHPMLRMGYGGLILAYNSTTNEATLSDAVAFVAGQTHSLVLRDRDGSAMGAPITVVAGAAPNKVILASDPPEALYFDTDSLRPLYAFGVVDKWSFLGKVVSVQPIDEAEIEITLLNYAPRVYDFDGAELDELGEPDYVKTPVVPTVGAVFYRHLGVTYDGTGKVTWSSAPGAISYVVELSADLGASWDRVAVTGATFAAVPVVLGNNVARVAGVGVAGQGAWTESNILVGAVTLPFATLTEDATPETDEDGTPAVDEDYTP